MLLLMRRRKSWSNFLFVFICCLKVNPWPIMKIWTSCNKFLDASNYPKMQWFDNTGWEMATYMHEVVNKIRNLVESVQFISFSCDEVTSCDQQSWALIHAYVVGGWQRILLLLSLQQVVDGATSYNLKCILVDVLVLYGDLTQENIASKLFTFGVDGVNVF